VLVTFGFDIEFDPLPWVIQGGRSAVCTSFCHADLFASRKRLGPEGKRTILRSDCKTLRLAWSVGAKPSFFRNCHAARNVPEGFEITSYVSLINTASFRSHFGPNAIATSSNQYPSQEETQ